MGGSGGNGHRGFAGRIAAAFIGSRLTPLVVIASILLGLGAVLLLPREEEPQIIVPMIDVFVQVPGASAKEVEERATRPMERLLREIPGVEYVYSTSSPASRWRSCASRWGRMRRTASSA
jgi:multidrug efflux pump subunit AcrB